MGNIRARMWYSWHIGRSECDKQGLLIICVHNSLRSYRRHWMKWELQRGDNSSAGSWKEMHPGKLESWVWCKTSSPSIQNLSIAAAAGYQSLHDIEEGGEKKPLFNAVSWGFVFFIQLFTIKFLHSCIFSTVNPWFATWHHVKIILFIWKLVGLLNTAV